MGGAGVEAVDYTIWTIWAIWAGTLNVCGWVVVYMPLPAAVWRGARNWECHKNEAQNANWGTKIDGNKNQARALLLLLLRL